MYKCCSSYIFLCVINNLKNSCLCNVNFYSSLISIMMIPTLLGIDISRRFIWLNKSIIVSYFGWSLMKTPCSTGIADYDVTITVHSRTKPFLAGYKAVVRYFGLRPARDSIVRKTSIPISYPAQFGTCSKVERGKNCIPRRFQRRRYTSPKLLEIESLNIKRSQLIISSRK